jgi:hypothetical protein
LGLRAWLRPLELFRARRAPKFLEEAAAALHDGGFTDVTIGWLGVSSLGYARGRR